LRDRMAIHLNFFICVYYNKWCPSVVLRDVGDRRNPGKLDDLSDLDACLDVG